MDGVVGLRELEASCECYLLQREGSGGIRYSLMQRQGENDGDDDDAAVCPPCLQTARPPRRPQEDPAVEAGGVVKRPFSARAAQGLSHHGDKFRDTWGPKTPWGAGPAFPRTPPRHAMAKQARRGRRPVQTLKQQQQQQQQQGMIRPRSAPLKRSPGGTAGNPSGEKTKKKTARKTASARPGSSCGSTGGGGRMATTGGGQGKALAI